MISTGCGSPETVEPAETTEERDIAHIDVKTSVSGWIPTNADNVSDTVGALVTADTPIAKEMVAKAVKTALLSELEISVDHTRPVNGADKYYARVALGFPLLLELPIVGKKEYMVMVSYDFTIDDGQVVEADIDASSFEMKEQ